MIDAGVAAVLVAASEVWRRLDWRETPTTTRVLACLIRIAMVLMAVNYALSALASVAGLSNGGS